MVWCCGVDVVGLWVAWCVMLCCSWSGAAVPWCSGGAVMQIIAWRAVIVGSKIADLVFRNDKGHLLLYYKCNIVFCILLRIMRILFDFDHKLTERHLVINKLWNKC